MSDFHALIRACKDEPDDDAPRLILADWLDEHGAADRAAFIRLTTGASSRRWTAEAGEVLDRLLPGWLGVFGLSTSLHFIRKSRSVTCIAYAADGPARTHEFIVHFARGFAERIELVPRCIDVLPALLKVHPLARVAASHLDRNIPDLSLGNTFRIDVAMDRIGDEVFNSLEGFDQFFRYGSSPFRYTSVKRFLRRKNEQAQWFRDRIGQAIGDAMIRAALCRLGVDSQS